MELQYLSNIQPNLDLVVVLEEIGESEAYCNSEEEKDYLKKKIEEKNSLIQINRYTQQVFFIFREKKEKEESYRIKEIYRNLGNELFQKVNQEKSEKIHIHCLLKNQEEALSLIEGLVLSTYQFLKYKSDKKENPLKSVSISGDSLNQALLDELAALSEGNFIARTLVNEPVLYLTAEKLSEEIEKLGNEAGFEVEVFHKAKIESLGMTGLLTVNKGSVQPPTFNVLEYKPENAKNTQPFILVGKGVVYDTGGLSLKPTGNSMDYMKCDMAGAAAVVGAVYAIAKNKLPIHIIGLIPATDNRPGGDAITPGDVITMMNGKTVEILNTDAEGRLILSDALCYASHFKPQLVIDMATLTGSAVRAVGYEAMVMMGTADEETKKSLADSGKEVFERMVELPLWDEYDEHIKSEIADINNLGRAEAGSITAGKFLQNFTDYPWIHLDIAGPAYLQTPNKYRAKGGTGSCVRLLYHFLKKNI